MELKCDGYMVLIYGRISDHIFSANNLSLVLQRLSDHKYRNLHKFCMVQSMDKKREWYGTIKDVIEQIKAESEG